jgi:sulfate adenylyltransferase (ADP) / ATP adenylyltransferase
MEEDVGSHLGARLRTRERPETLTSFVSVTKRRYQKGSTVACLMLSLAKRSKMFAGLRNDLKSLVSAKFDAAKSSRQLIFSPTDLTTIETTTNVPVRERQILILSRPFEASIFLNIEQFQLRYCPALAKKPVKEHAATQGSNERRDPFADPDKALLIAELPSDNPSHILVLNKYPVISEHFILATKENKQQTALLEEDDLEATYECLKAWERSPEETNPGRLFAFFNSGDFSGASQPHRHVQFLPVASMQEGSTAYRWTMLIDLIEEQASSARSSMSR